MMVPETFGLVRHGGPVVKDCRVHVKFVVGHRPLLHVSPLLFPYASCQSLLCCQIKAERKTFELMFL